MYEENDMKTNISFINIDFFEQHKTRIKILFFLE